MKPRPPKAALAAVHLRDIGTPRWKLLPRIYPMFRVNGSALG